MLFVHQNNLLKKINDDYHGKGTVIRDFYNTHYSEVKRLLSGLNFQSGNDEVFEEASEIITRYYRQLNEFARENRILSQSKFESTFLEEISVYLFKDIPEIANGTYGVFNKGVFAGLKIDSNNHITTIKKDVDFCIGRKVNVTIDRQPEIELILPLVSVEVKTYLDATMFGEVKSSSKALRSASPNSYTYVLMGHKNIAAEHIIAARLDSSLNEIFVLRANENAPFSADAIYEYWFEVTKALETIRNPNTLPQTGKQLNI